MLPSNATLAGFEVSVQTLERTATSLQTKAMWLRRNRSPDPIQQMQTDAILDLCDAVRQIQQAMSGLPLVIPDVGAVRDAAAASVNSAIKLSSIRR